MYDYGARWYDPSVGRFIGIDPAADFYPNWTPYSYVQNNPLKFIDPTGAFTELFGIDGKKIGEDENGNDGNVSIIANKAEAKRIRENTKAGNLATADDVMGGVQTTKTVLGEALDVLNRTIENGGQREEASLVMNDGQIISGPTGPIPTIENGVQTAETKVPALPSGKTDQDVAANIHSHPTSTFVDASGKAYPQTASQLNKTDVSVFVRFRTNIIVGATDQPRSYTQGQRRPIGAVIYQRGQKAPVTISDRALRKIIK